MAVVKYKTKLLTPRKGVCSTWLASLRPGSGRYIKVAINSNFLVDFVIVTVAYNYKTEFCKMYMLLNVWIF